MWEDILSHLEELSIYQLRSLGRQVGVNLPTTLKKADLIDRIKAIVNGFEKPHIKTTNKGRPAKELVSLNNLSDIENVSQSYLQNMEYIPMISGVESYQEIRPEDTSNYEKCEKEGFVEVTKNGYGLLYQVPQYSPDPIYVKNDIVERFGLLTGDKLDVIVLNDPVKNLTIVKEVLSINGESVYEMSESLDFLNSTSLFEKEKINVVVENPIEKIISDTLKIKLGDRVIIGVDEKSSVPYAVFKTLNYFNNAENITDVVFLGLDTNAELIDYISNIPKVTPMVSRFGDSIDYKKKIAILAFNYAIRLVDKPNKNVVMLVQNLNEVLDCFEGLENVEFSQYCKKYFSQAKQTDKSSLMCAYMILQGDLLDQYQSNENVFVKFLPYKYLTKSLIGFNLLESRRVEFLKKMNQTDEVCDKIVKFLNNGDYMQNHLELEKYMVSCDSMEELLKLI